MKQKNNQLRICRSLKLCFFILILPLGSLTTKVSASPAPTATPCKESQKELLQKKSNLIKMNLAIDSLLRSSGSELPLSILFHVDLNNEMAIKGRRIELESLLSKNALLSSPGYQHFLDCPSDSDFLLLLEEVIQSEVDLNSKKIQFLKLENETRDSLRAAYDSLLHDRENSKLFESQLNKSRELLEQAQTNLTKTEQESGKIQSATKVQIVSAKSILEKFLVAIEAEHLEFVQSMQERKQQLDLLQSQLNDLSGKLTKPTDLNILLGTSDSIWSQAADDLLALFKSLSIKSQYPLPASERFPTALDEDDKPLLLEYASTYGLASSRYQKLGQLKSELLRTNQAQNFRLLSDSGRVRAQLIQKCRKSPECLSLEPMSEKYFAGFAREIRILPIRFIAGWITKLIDIQAKLESGLSGWVDLSRQILILLILLSLPFGAYRLFFLISNRLSVLRSTVLSRSILDYRRRTRIATWISRLNPFVPPLGMVLTLELARNLLEATDIKEISTLLFYLEIFFIYRAVKLILRIGIEILFSHQSLEKAKELSLRAESTARSISRLIFIQYALLHLIQDTVRKALVYGVISKLAVFLFLILVISAFQRWRSEIWSSFTSRFAKITTLTPSIEKILSSPFGILLIPICFMMVVVHDFSHFIMANALKLDLVKRAYSDLFRRRLEQSEKASEKLQQIDPYYLKYFDYYLPANTEFLVEREPTVGLEAIHIGNTWLEDKSRDDLVIIVGNRGIGKTTTLNLFLSKIEAKDKRFQWVTAKTRTRKDFFDWLSKLTRTQISNIEDFIQYECLLPNKVIFVVDDIHNFFVGQIGGFEAYRLFAEVISLKTPRIFWCLSVNSHAWTYLCGVFGPEHFYGKVLRMRMWTDTEIQRLILARHEQTRFERSFDSSIEAYGTSNALGERTETQFFRLLWGQSRGNPRSALMYWTSAITQTYNHRIHVGVPRFIDPSVVGAMSDNSHLMLAAISKHDSLSREEIIEVTGINSLIVQKCLKESYDKELIWMDEFSRIRISSRAQNAIDYYLLGKNFLYEGGLL